MNAATGNFTGQPYQKSQRASRVDVLHQPFEDDGCLKIRGMLRNFRCVIESVLRGPRVL